MKTLLLLSVVLTGCVSATRLNTVSLGMSKQEVVQIMGTPQSTSAADGVEYLRYPLADERNAYSPYFIRLRDGKVDAYGREGDFDSTKDPTVNVNLNK